MNTARTVLTFILITTGLIVTGCTANKPYRTSFAPYDPASPDHTKAVIESTADYQMGFVEFDDQGWFWDTHQRDAVEQMIRTQAGLRLASDKSAHSDSTPQGIILVAFVHGWKDNSEYGSYGVAAFQEILTELNKAEQAQTDHAPRKVVGVYAGWRGLSATWEPFKELSIFERKDTAHKVGGYGALTQLFVDLENIQKDSLDALPPNAPRTELIIIGHSLGGAAVYSALSQIITERFVNTLGNTTHQQRLKPLGDQVILLNPAFEAVRHYDLDQMAKLIQAFPKDQRPVLSIFTSKGDWATHYVFPVYRFFSTLFENERSPEQNDADLTTVGWYEPFITHELHYNEKASATTNPTSTFNFQTKRHEFPNLDQMAKSVDKGSEQRGRWDPTVTTPKTYEFDDSLLVPLNYRPGYPFLVVSVDKQIMADHDDIADPVLINFIREYILFCQADSKDHRK